MGAFNFIGATQADEYVRKEEHPVPSIDVHLAAGIVALVYYVARVVMPRLNEVWHRWIKDLPTK